MLISAALGAFLLFSIWAVVYESWTVRSWPRDTYRLLLTAVFLWIVVLLTGAV